MKVSYQSVEYWEALSIRGQVFVIEQGVPEELEVDEFESLCDYFILKVDGAIVSTGRLRKKDKLIKFERIATLKDHRGKGLGEALLKEMMEYCHSHYPLLTPYMHSQQTALSFYKKHGWQEAGEIFFEAGIAHRAMIWKEHK